MAALPMLLSAGARSLNASDETKPASKSH